MDYPNDDLSFLYQRKRVGRPKGVKNGMGRKRAKPITNYIREDESDSDPSFALSASIATNTIRRSSRVRSRSSVFNESPSSDETSEEAPTNPQNEGPKIEMVIASPILGSSSQYLCKWPDKSIIHSTFVEHSALTAGMHSRQMLERFVQSMPNGFEIISNAGPIHIVSCVHPIESSQFFIDRIISHRGSEDFSVVSPHFIDPSHFIVSLPVEGRPDLSKIIAHSNPFQHPNQDTELFLQNDGSLKIESREINEYEGEDIEEAPELADVNQIVGPPMNTEFLVKWKNQGESKATWETKESLCNDIFCAANIDEFMKMATLYWKKISNDFNDNKDDLFIPEKSPMLSRGYNLTSDQKDTVLSIIETRKESLSISLVGEQYSGRSVTIVSYFQVMRKYFGCRKPYLIVTGSSYINTWSNDIKEMTDLIWSALTNRIEDRIIVKTNELCESRPVFDVLIVDFSVFYKEIETLLKIQWDSFIIDSRDGFEFDDGQIPEEVFRVFISDPIPNVPVLTLPASPFSYHEHIVLCDDSASSIVYGYLSEQLRTKQTRQYVEDYSVFILRLVLLARCHPLLISSMKKQCELSYRQNNRIDHMTPLSANDMNRIIESTSEKFRKLDSLIPLDSNTAIIANEFSVLRLINSYLTSKGYHCVFINTNIPSERSNEIRNNSILLMTRDCSSPLLDDLNISTAVLFDLPDYLEKDHHILRYLSRRSNVTVYRLLVFDTSETAMFSTMLTEPKFIISKLVPFHCERFLRVCGLSTKPIREKKAHPSIIEYDYPSGLNEILNSFGETFDEVKDDNEFWEEVFPSPTNHRIKPTNWKLNEVLAFINIFLNHGYGQWEDMSLECEHDSEECAQMGRAILLLVLSKAAQTELTRYNILTAILYKDYFGEPYNNQFIENPAFWNRIATNDPFLSTQLFSSKKLTSTILSLQNRILPRLEKHWLIRAFLDINDEQFLPNRFILFKPLNAQYITKVLKAFLMYDTSAQVAQTIENSTPQSVETVYNSVVPWISYDIYSRVLGMIKHGQTSNNPLLEPIFMIFTKGPFSPLWSDSLVKVIEQILFEFGIPLNHDGSKNWEEFHALTRITSKSTKMIMEYVNFFIDLSFQLSPGSSLVIPNVSPQNHVLRHQIVPITVAPERISLLKSRLTMMTHVRGILQTNSIFYKKYAGLPDAWDSDCDKAILEGLCQYGYSRVQYLSRIEIKPISKYYQDHQMCRDLTSFNDFCKDLKTISHHVSLIIMSSGFVKRKIGFYDGIVKRIELVPPEPIKGRTPSEMNSLKEKYLSLKTEEQRAYMRKCYPELVKLIQSEESKLAKLKKKHSSTKSKRLSPPKPLGKTSSRRSGDQTIEPQIKEETLQKANEPIETKPKEESDTDEEHSGVKPRRSIRKRSSVTLDEAINEKDSFDEFPKRKRGRPTIKKSNDNLVDSTVSQNDTQNPPSIETQKTNNESQAKTENDYATNEDENSNIRMTRKMKRDTERHKSFNDDLNEDDEVILKHTTRSRKQMDLHEETIDAEETIEGSNDTKKVRIVLKNKIQKEIPKTDSLTEVQHDDYPQGRLTRSQLRMIEMNNNQELSEEEVIIKRTSRTRSHNETPVTVEKPPKILLKAEVPQPPEPEPEPEPETLPKLSFTFTSLEEIPKIVFFVSNKGEKKELVKIKQKLAAKKEEIPEVEEIEVVPKRRSERIIEHTIKTESKPAKKIENVKPPPSNKPKTEKVVEAPKQEPNGIMTRQREKELQKSSKKGSRVIYDKEVSSDIDDEAPKTRRSNRKIRPLK